MLYRTVPCNTVPSDTRVRSTAANTAAGVAICIITRYPHYHYYYFASEDIFFLLLLLLLITSINNDNNECKSDSDWRLFLISVVGFSRPVRYGVDAAVLLLVTHALHIFPLSLCSSPPKF